MNYRETCEYLFTRTPLFHKTGASAYKPGLGTTEALDEYLGHPHRRYRTIHVGGTNGKGSTSHTLAAILQEAGYKVGLFTSPHLVDFRERIRVNGQMCSEDFVVKFVEQHRAFFEPLSPSFFEVTTAMAFQYFAEQNVDVAVVEVGLGGRLDCTNIIRPVLSIVTNISLDHTDLLGDTLQQIASEKAGIMKPGVPFVLGESCEETLPVFQAQAEKVGCPLYLAEDYRGELPIGALRGDCQQANMRTILTAVSLLSPSALSSVPVPISSVPASPVPPASLPITPAHVDAGINKVCSLTGLHGRWETLCTAPLTLCDVGHNAGAWEYLGPRLEAIAADHEAEHAGCLRIVFGMCADKDVSRVLKMLPSKAVYYWAQADTHRAVPAAELASQAAEFGLAGQCYTTVNEAYMAAKLAASEADTIFVGGSCYVVADLLTMFSKDNSFSL